MKSGRNDPCPCGSGKKYKKCCLSSTYTAKGKEDSIRERLVQDLLEFFRKNHDDSFDDAYPEFWEDFNPEEHLDENTLPMADINFWEWIVHDYLIDDENKKSLIDFFMESNKKLSSDEHRVLMMMKHSIISLYEVQEVFPGKGLILKDLLLGGEYDVSEKAATGSLRKWDTFATRLLHIDGKYIMSGAVYPYQVKLKEGILEDINAEFEDYRLDYPEAALDEFLKENSWLFNFYWYDMIQNPAPLNLATTTGEPFLFSKAVFEIVDKSSGMSSLQKIKGFEQDEDDFVWLDKQKKEGSATVLGNVEIKGNKLILSCNSKKRLEKGKKLILENAAEMLIHKVDTFQDPMEAVKSLKNKPPEKREDKIPMEIQQQVYNEFMKNHYEKWITDKIPALDGKTPVQAVKTAKGRLKVIELLKSFENGEEHKKREGEPFYDLSWMWGKLGLEREG
jgi:hypothetical protein